MRRELALCLALYAPHLAEEALTGMHDDPIVVSVMAPLASLPPRHAAYLVFQVMLGLALAMTLLFSLGGPARLALMGALGAALLAEAHHAVRAVAAGAYNPGLVTSLPMPLVGAVVVARVARAWPGRVGSSTLFGDRSRS